MTCPHGGAVQVIPSDPLAPATAGVPVLTADARMVVVGCAAQPTPCATVQWLNLGQALVHGVPVLLQATPSGPGGGTCLGSVTPAPPQVISLPTTVTGA